MTGVNPHLKSIAIEDLTRELCARIGVEPTRVYKIEIEPMRATAQVYLTENGLEDGKKQVIGGEAARGRVTVRTDF